MNEKNKIKDASDAFVLEIKNTNVNRVQDLVMLIIMFLTVKINKE